MTHTNTDSQHRISIETNESAHWLIASFAVLRVQAAAQEAGNGLVVRAAQALWNADMRREREPIAWRIVAEFAQTMEART